MSEDAVLIQEFLNASLTADILSMERYYKEYGPFFINAVDQSSGDTHAHVSARAGWCFILRWLWRRGLDINVQNKHGNTPAHEAAFAGHLETLQWLAGHHLSLYIRNEKNLSVVHHAAYGGHLAVLKWLLLIDNTFLNHCDIWNNNALHYSAYQASPGVLMLLHSHGASLQTQNEKGETVVHIAASNKNIKVLEWCYEAGMDMNALNFQGQTPAHCAAIRDSISTMIWLADHGSNLFALDNSSKSAFDIASQRSLKHADKLYKYLRHSQNSNQLWANDSLLQVDKAIDEKTQNVERITQSAVKTSQTQMVQALMQHNITEPTYAKVYLEAHYPEMFRELLDHLEIPALELASTLASISKWSLYNQYQTNNQLDA